MYWYGCGHPVSTDSTSSSSCIIFSSAGSMAHPHAHAPLTDMYDNDDSESMRRVMPLASRHHRLSSTSSSASEAEYGFPEGKDPQRMSVLGPRLTKVSDAPWEAGNPSPLDDDEDLDNGLDTLSLFGGSKRGRTLDWKRPFAQQPRSSSASQRPSRDFGSAPATVKDKGGLSIYGNSLASRSAASLSVYSIASGKDVFAADAVPPLPVPMPASSFAAAPGVAGKGPRLRTASAGASARSSVFSAVSSRSHNSSSGNEVPPMPFPRGFEPVDSPHQNSHPYAHPDLVDSKPSLHRTDSVPDDGQSLLAPSLTHTSATRSPRSPRSPLAVNAHPSTVISTPMPAAPGALQGLAMSHAWPNGGGTGTSYSLISLEQAQAQQRAKSAQRSMPSSPATSSFPMTVSTLPFDPLLAERDRQRKASLGAINTGASYLPPEPADAQGPPGNKTVKPRRSGFLKLLRGNSKDKDSGGQSPLEPAPAVPPLPSRPTISHPHAPRFEPREAMTVSDKHAPASPTDSDSPDGHSFFAHSQTASPRSSSIKRVAPPVLSLVVTPSTSPNQHKKPGRAGSSPLTVDLSPDSQQGGTPPRSAPPVVATIDTPALSLRPMSTLFSGLPQDMFVPSKGSPGASRPMESISAVVSANPSPVNPSPEDVENWRTTIASLEQEVQQLRGQMAEMRALAACAICDKCGGGLVNTMSSSSLGAISAADSGVSFGTSSSMSSVGTYGSTEPPHSAHSVSSHHDGGLTPHGLVAHDTDRTPPTESWRARGVSVVDRPRARTAGRDRTTFAAMWRD